MASSPGQSSSDYNGLVGLNHGQLELHADEDGTGELRRHTRAAGGGGGGSLAGVPSAVAPPAPCTRTYV